MKVSSLTFLTVSVVFLSLFGVVITANAQKKEIGINTVVIDAGHGGRDAGAVGRIYKEKDINLDVALRLGKMIGQKYPDVKVVYTRKTDVLIPLNERGNIANKAGADLFISIHINSNKSSAPSGTSTYVMGVDKAGKNLDVAMKENDVISYEDDYSTKYQGYVPGSPESFIIFSLIQSAYLSQSCTFADMVQKQFASQTKMQNRGVHQAGFWCCGRRRCRASWRSSGLFRIPRRRSSSVRTKGARRMRAVCSTHSASTRCAARDVAHGLF